MTNTQQELVKAWKNIDGFEHLADPNVDPERILQLTAYTTGAKICDIIEALMLAGLVADKPRME